MNPNVNPDSIMMDYEKAEMHAVISEFSNTVINGCFFTYLSYLSFFET